VNSQIELVGSEGKPIGWVKISGRLPDFLLIEGELFQRYGQVGNYRYVQEPNVWTPPGKDVTKLL
jgi:hypothetical protein